MATQDEDMNMDDTTQQQEADEMREDTGSTELEDSEDSII
jgi:hypothetical protein